MGPTVIPPPTHHLSIAYMKTGSHPETQITPRREIEEHRTTGTGRNSGRKTENRAANTALAQRKRLRASKKNKRKTLITQLAPNPLPILQALHNTQPGTRIALVARAPFTHPEAATLQEIQAYTVAVLKTQPTIITIPSKYPAKAVETILDYLLETQPTTLTVDLTGAEPYTATTLYTAALIYTAATGTPATIILDRTPEPITLNTKTVTTILHKKLTKTQEQIAQTLTTKQQTTPQELEKQTGKAPTTIQKQLNQLKNLEMITKQKNTIIPTPWLKIYTKIYKKQTKHPTTKQNQ